MTTVMATKQEPSLQWTVRVPFSVVERIRALEATSAQAFTLRAILLLVEQEEAREREAAAHEAKEQGGSK